MLGDILSTTTQLSPRYTLGDFTRSDTAIKLGLSNLPPESMMPDLKRLASILELMESKHGSIRLVSAYRTPEVNKAVGGASGSKHTAGTALDFSPLSPLDVKTYWLNLISDVELMPLLGEVSWKTHQGTIHITLPYTLPFPGAKGSARIADATGYYRNESPIGIQLLSKFGIGNNPLVAAAGLAPGYGLGIFMAALGLLSVVFVLKRRK